MAKNLQTTFDDPSFEKELSFGGTFLKKAKNRHYRPLNRKYPLHLVLRSTHATGPRSLSAHGNKQEVKTILDKCCKDYGVKVLEFSNNSNHLHLLVWVANRPLYCKFIRVFTGRVAQVIMKTNAHKGLSDLGIKRFWNRRPFTRIVVGWRGYKVARDYVLLNKLETLGVIPYQKKRLSGFHRPLLV